MVGSLALTSPGRWCHTDVRYLSLTQPATCMPGMTEPTRTSTHTASMHRSLSSQPMASTATLTCFSETFDIQGWNYRQLQLARQDWGLVSIKCCWLPRESNETYIVDTDSSNFSTSLSNLSRYLFMFFTLFNINSLLNFMLADPQTSSVSLHGITIVISCPVKS